MVVMKVVVEDVEVNMADWLDMLKRTLACFIPLGDQRCGRVATSSETDGASYLSGTGMIEGEDRE
jgi:hypothetical protein